ncbi:MAG: hypothetical protein JRI97_03030, partial [Deltaproteobacteria bacterium]|nr:hypothetical protein [Deltaproteobacteria bacterium]
ARPISALAALSGLGVPKYAFTPLALPARKSGFVNNPGYSVKFFMNDSG